MNKFHNYEKGTTQELLNDDYFLNSELHPTEESRNFWKQAEEENPMLAEEIKIARLFLQQIKNTCQTPELSIEAQDGLWVRIKTTNNKQDTKQRYYLIKVIATAVTAVAASVIITLTYTGEQMTVSDEQQKINYTAMVDSAPQTKDVLLILSDDKKLSFEEKETQVNYQKGGGLSVNSKKVDVTENNQQAEAYNQLIVPAGKHSSLTFADGTQLWVNSGSRVIYPVNFAKDKREIFVEGEVYLNVAHIENRPFIVKTNRINVEVTGTQFNVSDYKSDADCQVVLVKGGVKVNLDNQKKSILSPNQMFHYNNLTKKSETINVNDINHYISWKDGYYLFYQDKLTTVLEKIARYYGVEIEWNEDINELSCSGKLDLKDNLDKVFEAIKKAAPIQIEKGKEIIKISIKS
ncbi:MAG: FecR family protein [Tannerellaceae bacterium]